jgi:iron complex transport system permease protein
MPAMAANNADTTHSAYRIAIRRRLLLVLFAALLVAVFALHLGVGSYQLYSPFAVVKELMSPGSGTPDNNIIWKLRLPRACSCVVVGATLALVGAAFQSLFRNPLAEPYVVGVSSGSAVGGALAYVGGFGASWQGFSAGMGPMIAAFPAGLLSLALVYGLAKRRGVIDIHTLLLAGVVVGAMLSALLSLVLLAGGEDTRTVLQWLLGSMTPSYWNRVGIMAIALLLGTLVLIANSKRLNAFALGEDTAQRLGVNVKRLKPAVLVAGTGMVASTVGAVGVIGFLGLVAPHLARRSVGVDWRWSLAASGLLGSGLLLISDLLAQRIIPDAEIPVGIVTALVGAPFLLVLLRKE